MSTPSTDVPRSGHIALFGVTLSWSIARTRKSPRMFVADAYQRPYRVHLGPGPNWVKPDDHWINVDIDPRWGDIVVDFQDFKSFPIEDGSVDCIYGSHVFEHMSIWVTDKLLSECHRILQPGGVLRMVLPDVEKSIHEYVSRDASFPLFKRRRERAANVYGLDYTLFDCLREDFLSRSGQSSLLGRGALAHQNAWDYESIERDLNRAGFAVVERSMLSGSRYNQFAFEGSYKCEALEMDRSLYVDAQKR